MIEEVWKTIPNYEDYQVSSFGNVRSYKKGIERIIKPIIGVGGYFFVNLWGNSKQKTITIHTLVAIVFLDHKPSGYNVVVDHINNIRTDNRLENLQLTTHRHNTSKDRVGRSKHTGICLHGPSQKWVPHIYFKGRQIHLGYYTCEDEAAEVYQKALNELNQGLDLNIIYPKGFIRPKKILGRKEKKPKFVPTKPTTMIDAIIKPELVADIRKNMSLKMKLCEINGVDMPAIDALFRPSKANGRTHAQKATNYKNLVAIKEAYKFYSIEEFVTLVEIPV